jgi:putative two-component system response regulator
MSRLLIVDDEEALRRWAARILGEHGYACDTAADGAEARAALHASDFQLALLDIHMPGESGIDLLAHIRSQHPECAVVMVTGEDSLELAVSAIELGAFGYIVKPAERGELLIGVVNALHRRRRELESRQLLDSMRGTVADRSQELAQALQDLQLSQTKVWSAQAETILRLARLVEYRDEETGQHLQRMSSYCEILARRHGLDEDDCEQIRLASQLHDVGKVAIPDAILLKPGKLTSEEFETVKRHSEIGYEMLAGSPSEIVQVGARIARSHHERWDGSGYPRGLAGEAIPLEGRIAAVADVFDALSSDRVYRPAFPPGVAVEMMRAERTTHFDPELLDEFVAALPEVERVRQAYAV